MIRMTSKKAIIMGFRYTLSEMLPLKNWVVRDGNEAYVATVASRELGEQIVEGLILREFMWQAGLKPGCWHVFSPVPYRELDDPLAAWQMTCLECGGFFGMKPPTLQSEQPHE